MEQKFKKIKHQEINENTFTLIGEEWMLITAGNKESFNTMTAAWGCFGILWNKPVTVCFIRPQRYTYQFTEKHEYYTLSYFSKEYKEALLLCGNKSGRDTDKVKATGFTPLITDLGNVFFEQAKLVIECRKIYYDDLKPGNFLDKKIDKNYPQKDYHRMYVGEIVNCFEAE